MGARGCREVRVPGGVQGYTGCRLVKELGGWLVISLGEGDGLAWIGDGGWFEIGADKGGRQSTLEGGGGGRSKIQNRCIYISSKFVRIYFVYTNYPRCIASSSVQVSITPRRRSRTENDKIKRIHDAQTKMYRMISYSVKGAPKTQRYAENNKQLANVKIGYILEHIRHSTLNIPKTGDRAHMPPVGPSNPQNA